MYFRICLIYFFINSVCTQCPNRGRPLLETNLLSRLFTNRIQFIFFPPGTSTIDPDNVYSYECGCNIIDNPKYNSNLPTYIFQHGYTENCFLTNDFMSCGIVIKAVAKYGKANLIIVNYDKLVSRMFKMDWIDYPRAVSNIKTIGPELCKFYECFFKQCNCNNSTKIIGFSLGAQEIFFTFRRCGVKPKYAVGLDPAGPLFFKYDSLNKNNAKYLQIIHTNPGDTFALSSNGPYGNRFNLATIDFWINHSKAPYQPFCQKNSTVLSLYRNKVNLCSHYASVYYFMRTLNEPTAYLAHDCNDIVPSTEYMGFGSSETKTGQYCVDAESF